jgi:hypothetical protein
LISDQRKQVSDIDDGAAVPMTTSCIFQDGHGDVKRLWYQISRYILDHNAAGNAILEGLPPPGLVGLVVIDGLEVGGGHGTHAVCYRDALDVGMHAGELAQEL